MLELNDNLSMNYINYMNMNDDTINENIAKLDN